MARNDWLSDDEKYQQAVAEVQRQAAEREAAAYTNRGYNRAEAADNIAGTPIRRGMSNTDATTNYMVAFGDDLGTDALGRVIQTGGLIDEDGRRDIPNNVTTSGRKNTSTNEPANNSTGGGGAGGGAAAPSYTYNPSYGAGSGPTMSGYYDPTKDPQYMAALQALQVAQEKPPAYVNSFEGQLADLYDQIVNRDKFRYDLNADMLYQQYKNQYMDLGQQAMRDTMGQAAGLTGGYGSTYAQNAGQQAYQSYLQRLNDVAPELYDRAFNTWLHEGDEMVRNYGLLQGRADDEYQKYLNDYNQWAADRAYAQDAEQLAYNRGKDQWATQYGAAQDRAKVLASYGDYSGYADIYGGDAANALQRNWIYDNPDLALRNGLISQAEYNALVPQPAYSGGNPTGYDINALLKMINGDNPGGDNHGGGGGGGGDGRVSEIEEAIDALYNGGKNVQDAQRSLEDAYAGGYLTQADYQRLKGKYR